MLPTIICFLLFSFFFFQIVRLKPKSTASVNLSHLSYRNTPVWKCSRKPPAKENNYHLVENIAFSLPCAR